MAEEWFNKISHIIKSHDPDNPTIDSLLYMLNHLYERASKLELENIEEVSSDPVKETVETKKTETKTVSSGEGTPVLAPIQGNVLDVKVTVGKQVKKGDCLLIIEAMKLENEVLAPCDGVVSEIIVTKGKTVSTKELLLTIK